MISLAYKAIQEQQEQINKLEERIKLIERNQYGRYYFKGKGIKSKFD